MTRRRVTDNRATWGTFTKLMVNGYALEVWGAQPAHLAIIKETLSKIPIPHLRLIPRVVVGDVVGGGTIEQGGNSVRRQPEPRLELSTGAMDNPGKLKPARTGGNVHVTVLHETGHHVDWLGGGVARGLTPAQLRELNAWFGTIGYSGVTQGSGEARAELYWRLYVASSTLPVSLRTAACAALGIR